MFRSKITLVEMITNLKSDTRPQQDTEQAKKVEWGCVLFI